MKREDYLKGEQSLSRHCAIRAFCPLGGHLCVGGAVDEDDSNRLMPTVAQVKQGDLLWAHFGCERRVLIVQSGIFVVMANLEGDREVPFALCGAGASAGIAELYTLGEITDTYYLRALTDATVCSFPARPMRHYLEAMPTTDALRLVACATMNHSTSAYAQTKVMANALVYDRIVYLFACMRDLLAREGHALDAVRLTHDEIAQLVAADRASTTRALHKMEDEGLVVLGYRSIEVRPSLFTKKDDGLDAHQVFHIPPAPGASSSQVV